MKKNISIITGCALLLSISSIAYAAEGPYLCGNVGLAMANDSDVTEPVSLPGITLNFEFDKGFGVGGAVGYGIGNIRVEGEIAYQKNDMDKATAEGFAGSADLTGNISSTALLFNGYYDFKNESAFTPFISVGIGVAKVNVNDFNTPGSGVPNADEDDTVFAYQVGAGIAYAVNDRVNIDVKYRYFATEDPEFDTVKTEYSSHNVYAGVRVYF
jgi:opacity protein-like surface antigen